MEGAPNSYFCPTICPPLEKIVALILKVKVLPAIGVIENLFFFKIADFVQFKLVEVQSSAISNELSHLIIHFKKL